MDVLSEGKSPGRTLSHAIACSALKETLEKHRTSLNLKVDRIRAQEDKEAKSVIKLNFHKLKLEADQRVKETRLQYLDQEVAEKLDEIEGKTSFHHEKKLLSRAPTFNFSLSAKFPIRSHTRNQSDGVQWLKFQYVVGSYELNATAKGAMFKAASAGIILYGWRKEVHHIEITELRGSVTKLKTDIKEVRDEMGKINDKTCNLNIERRALLQELVVCSTDLGVIGAGKSRTSERPTSNEYLRIGSISGFASSIGLRTKVDERVLPYGLLRTMDEYKNEISSAKIAMDKYWGQYQWVIAQTTGAELRKIDGRIRNAISRLSNLNKGGGPMDQNSQANNVDDPEVVSLRSESRQDILALSNEVAPEARELGSKLDKITTMASQDGYGLIEWKSKRAMLERQSAAVEISCRSVFAKRQDVGIAATLETSWRGAEDISPFFYIYKGEKLLLDASAYN
ncbi:hypothetical protein B0T17DRAFT_67428 [Bombardia bombarda]|uniref:Uncharacterized protein n=1 Tax=Bombardia bombarda TaxID=252184 RepID=A0AA39XMP0_9PEZI|nr:hypothetical protein B0T17DRAFT_67428 [Bombardia bombarda]